MEFGALDVHDNVGDIIEGDVRRRDRKLIVRAGRGHLRLLGVRAPEEEVVGAAAAKQQQRKQAAAGHDQKLRVAEKFLNKTLLRRIAFGFAFAVFLVGVVVRRFLFLILRHAWMPFARNLTGEIRRTWLRTGSNRLSEIAKAEKLAGQFGVVSGMTPQK